MSDLAEQLRRWEKSRCDQVPVAGLLARCPIAHKWKAPLRALVVREALLWRMHDLGQQILCLRSHGYVLGERILIRSAIETLAILIYLNSKISGVLGSTVAFADFNKCTKCLLMGSKNGVTKVTAVNVLSVLKQADKQYPGLSSMHEHFSESAHPNYDGVLCGYSTLNPETYETSFSNQFEAMFGAEQEEASALLYQTFEQEYNDVWVENFTRLEAWLRANNELLEVHSDAN